MNFLDHQVTYYNSNKMKKKMADAEKTHFDNIIRVDYEASADLSSRS